MAIISELSAPFKTTARELEGGVHAYTRDGSTLINTFTADGALIKMKIERSAPKGKMFGFTLAQTITVELLGKVSLEKDMQLRPYINIKNSSQTGVLPYFYIDSVEVSETENKTIIKAIDIIGRTEKKLLNDCVFKNGGPLSVIYPVDLWTFTTLLITNNLTEYNVEIFNENSNLNTGFEYSAYDGYINFEGIETIRVALNAVAEMTGSVCYCDQKSRIVFKPIKSVETDTLEPNNYFKFSVQKPTVLTRLVSADELDENMAVGNKGYQQVLRNNPFLSLRKTDKSYRLEKIHDYVNGLEIIPFKLDFRGCPYYQPCMVLNVVDLDGKTHAVRLYNETLTYDGGLRSTAECQIEDEEIAEAAPTTIGDAISQTFARVDKVSKEIELVVSDIGSLPDEIANLKLTTNSITSEVERINSSTANAFQATYDQINVIAERVEQTLTPESASILIQQELNAGVNTVVTTTGYVFDSDGLNISKTGSEMTTTISEDGMSIFRNEKEVLNADNSGVYAENLHATTFLIVGKNSRFENYTPDGEERTGCFWIGL